MILEKLLNLNDESKEDRDEALFFDYISKYFNNEQITYNEKKYFIIRNDEDIIYKFKVLTFNDGKIEEVKVSSGILKEMQKKYSIGRENINGLIGFLSKFKLSTTYVFKIKLLEKKKNNTGRKCGGNKSELINIVNSLYKLMLKVINKEDIDNQNRYFKEDESSNFNKKNNFTGNSEKIGKLDPTKLCIEIEMLFRYLDYEYNKRNEEKKRFFFKVIEEHLYELKSIPMLTDEQQKNSRFLT